MKDQDKSREQMITENEELRGQIAGMKQEIAICRSDIFRKFAEASGEGFGMGDLDGRIVYANPSLCRLFGEKSPADVIGKNVSMYYPQDYLQRRRNEIIPALLREGHWHVEQTILPRHGKPIQTLQSTFLIRDENGNALRTAVVISDITERKQAEAALRTSEEKYRSVVDACPDAVVMSDLNGQVLFASRQTWKLLGLSDSDELLGGSVFGWVIENDRKRLAENMSNLVEAGVRRNTEYTSIRRDGTTVPVDVSSVAIRDAAGQPKAVMAVIRDITVRRKAQAALERERRTLKHMLEASDHERRLISYEIHDGLAQELAGAIMQFQIYAHARQANPKDAAEAFDSAMAMLQQSHGEARRLISGVRPPILDESGVMTAIAHLVYDPAFHEGPKIDFRNRVTFKHLAPVMENAIYRIVQEGLSNARNHSKSEKILVRLIQRGDRLRVEIRDWGVGFDPQALQGNHFGLEGIRERARLLAGKCSIKSTPGKGTAIAVELPAVERE